jgi:hypothetical protein
VYAPAGRVEACAGALSESPIASATIVFVTQTIRSMQRLVSSTDRGGAKEGYVEVKQAGFRKA